MDTNVNKPRQGESADLSQQEPHTEVVEKNSATSSEKERLAAGISAIELQTKRLSGAQRKKLMRERKMKEGTWTAEIPQRKTPPFQAKGATGNSGDMKRPHSDSSTPSQEKQQP
jgi:hypothetical protein